MSRRRVSPASVAPADILYETVRPIFKAYRHTLLVDYFTSVDRPTDGPVARATALAAFLDGPASGAPSGRLDALVDLGNPMKGAALFPFLRRRVEGRALAGI